MHLDPLSVAGIRSEQQIWEDQMRARIVSSNRSARSSKRPPTQQVIRATIIASIIGLGASAAFAQSSSPVPANAPAYMPHTWISSLSAPFPASLANGGIGASIPVTENTLDSTGILGSYQTGGAATTTATNAFFQSLGTNGRTCATCHQPASSMSINEATILTRYVLTAGTDPLFSPVDGANCPNAVPAANTKASYFGKHLGKGKNFLAAHSLILTRGVFRIFLPLPQNAEFTVAVVSDPAGCNTDPNYNPVTDPTTGVVSQIVSVYRRPRIASNLIFETTTLASQGAFPPLDPITGAPLATDPFTGLIESGNIMWDGREPTLESQAIDATLGHAQALTAPTTAQVAQMVAFENQFFSAQMTDIKAGSLTAVGGLGGPVNLSATVLAPAPPGTPPFSTYSAYSTLTADNAADAKRASIYRGQQIFQTRTFTIGGVAGLNNIPVLGNNIPGTCSTCHSQTNAGNDSFP
ncbi:MAG: hypothetical protein ABSF50_19515, partial [Burkholderiaceae bacterium]